MDTSGFCQVGRHGTLSLLKRQNTPGDDAEDSILTSFGIDDDELTFGSSTTCGVRLYYSDVDSLHCKVVFDQFKAFLAVLGSTGAVVDGCQVYPHTSGGTSGSMQQTIVPLNNDSIFEIHGKRFRFNYPPKELRKALYATPARPPKRALRLSMIHSAQVFSPRPSNDPRENLRILQSPVKKPSSPVKNPSPLKSAILPQIEEEEIVLVHTNHPRVVEEEKDLVILEDVPIQLLSPVKTQQVNQFPVIQVQHQPPCTPHRRSLGGTALHRAVLIRSAQRAVMKAEKEREEVQEELEVFGTVVANDGDYESTLKVTEATEVEDAEMMDIDDDDEETDDDDDDDEPEGQTHKSLWRKSLEKIIPWPLNGVETEDKDRPEDEDEDPATDRTYNRKEESVEMFPPIKPFMTPQPRHQSRTVGSKDVRAGPLAHPGRFSLGGQARRVIIEQPWKVHDLVLPPITPSKGDLQPFRPVNPPAPTNLSYDGPSVATPLKTASAIDGPPLNEISVSAITIEERRAIQERRKSAVKEFGATQFWVGGAPGMSPVKGNLNVLSPNKRTTVSPTKRPVYGSPTKARLCVLPIPESGDMEARNDDEDLDTSGLLDKIKETVNDMKRRRSVVLGRSSTVGTYSLTSVPEDVTIHTADPTVSAPPEEPSLRKVDFTKIGTPFKTPSKRHPTPTSSPKKGVINDEERTETTHQGESFSLLRPGALEQRRKSVVSIPVRREEVVTVVPVPLITVEHASMLESEEEPKKAVARGRTRALRSGSNMAERNEGFPDMETEGNDGDTKLKATKTDNTKAPSARRQRSKTPQPATVAIDSSSGDVSQRTSRSAASGKATTAVNTPQHIPSETDNVEKPAVRRVRKAQTVAKVEDEIKSIQVAPKRGRPRKNAAPAETSQDGGTRSTTSKVRGIVRRKTPANARETDSEDDPLDSYEVDGVPRPPSAEDGTDCPPTGDKPKSQAAVTKNKAATRITQGELVEESTLPVTTTTRVGRRTKATTVSQLPDVTPAVKTATGKTRGRPKTPATAPANTGTSIVEEKENTVGSRSSSKLKSTEKVAGSEAEELPVKLRVSRRAASRTAKIIEEGDAEQAPPARQRVTRVMRTRTKTG